MLFEKSPLFQKILMRALISVIFGFSSILFSIAYSVAFR